MPPVRHCHRAVAADHRGRRDRVVRSQQRDSEPLSLAGQQDPPNRWTGPSTSLTAETVEEPVALRSDGGFIRREASKTEQPQRLSPRPEPTSPTRDTSNLCVHRRASCSVRGSSDLPCADRVRVHDRPENLPRLVQTCAVETGAVGHDRHRNPGQLLRTRRSRPAGAGVVVWRGEDVGAPAASEDPGRPMHDRAADADQRVAGRSAAQEDLHHRTGSGGLTSTGPGRSPVSGASAEYAARRRFHLRSPGHWHVRIHGVRDRRLRWAYLGLGMLDQQTGRIRELCDTPSRSSAGPKRTSVGGQRHPSFGRRVARTVRLIISLLPAHVAGSPCRRPAGRRRATAPR